MLDETKLQSLLEALIMASSKPLTEENLLAFFSEEERPSKGVVKQALKDLQASFDDRGIHLVELASGYQFQVKPEWHPWVGRLWEEKAPRYSRALFETLALIAYRQPITRGEIEDIRGVSLSPSIFKTLMEDREWIRIVGHREVPGRPALYATTKAFLDYFGLKTLEQLPSLPEIMNLDSDKIEEAELMLSEQAAHSVSRVAALENADDVEFDEIREEEELIDEEVALPSYETKDDDDDEVGDEQEEELYESDDDYEDEDEGEQDYEMQEMEEELEDEENTKVSG